MPQQSDWYEQWKANQRQPSASTDWYEQWKMKNEVPTTKPVITAAPAPKPPPTISDDSMLSQGIFNRFGYRPAAEPLQNNIFSQVGSRVGEAASGLWESIPMVQNIRAMQVSQKPKEERDAIYAKQLADQQAALEKSVSNPWEITKSLSRVLTPTDALGGLMDMGEQTVEDVRTGNYGGAVANVGLVGIGARAGYKSLVDTAPPAMLPQTPKVEVLPPLQLPEAKIKKPLQLPQNVEPGWGDTSPQWGDVSPYPRQVPEPFTPFPPPPPKPDFIGHPYGKVADVTDINFADDIAALDRKKHGTTATDYEMRPDQYVKLGKDLPPIEPPDLTGRSTKELAHLATTADQAVEKLIRQELDRRRKATGGQTLSSTGLGEASRILRTEFDEWRVLKNLPSNQAAFQQFLQETGRFAGPATMHGQTPESYSQPRSMGVTERPEVPIERKTEKTRVKYVNEEGKLRTKTVKEEVPVDVSPEIEQAIMGRKYGGERFGGRTIAGEVKSGDWLDEDLLYGNVPDRLRPESPQARMMRTLSEGQNRPGEKLEFVSGERGWDLEPTTVEMGEGNKGRVRYPKPIDPNAGMLPTAPKPEREYPLGARSAGPFRPFPRKTSKPSISSERFALGDTSDLPLIERMKQEFEESKRKAETPVEPPSKRGTKTILNNPTDDDIKLREAQGWSVVGRSKSGDVTMEFTGIPAAKVEGKAGKVFYQKFMENNPRFKAVMDKLIKTRSADKLIGKGIRKDFEHIAGFTKDQVAEFQRLLAKGDFREVRKFYDDLHADMISKGIEMGTKENYLPQIWENPPDEVKAVFGDKELNQRASFQYRSVIEDYQKGIDKGLKPKMSPIELMEWYGKRANKLKADRAALKELKDAGYIVRKENRVSGMQPMDPGFGSFAGYFADPSVKKVIENYLQSADNQSGFGAALSKGVGKATNVALSSGLVPNKPLFTAHGLSIGLPGMGRAFMEGGVKRNVQAFKYGWSPKKAAALLEKEHAQILKATQEHGFKMNVEDAPGAHGGKFFEKPDIGRAKRGFNWLSEKQNKYFEAPLFDKMIPAVKWESWKANYAKAIKKGMSEAEAGAHATKISDSFYSGKNIDLLYTNKNFTTMARILTLAPDWLRSTVDLGVNVPKSFVPMLKDSNSLAAKSYRSAGYKLLGAYTVANLIEKMNTGEFLVEKPAEDMFSLSMGKTSEGKDRKLKLFGSAADMFKIPAQMAKATLDNAGGGEVMASAIEARSSPLVRAGMAFLTGEDYKGETNFFKTRDRFGREIPASERLGNTLSQAINFGPPQVAAPFSAATGRMGLEEMFSRVGEAPFTYKKKKPFNAKDFGR